MGDVVHCMCSHMATAALIRGNINFVLLAAVQGKTTIQATLYNTDRALGIIMQVYSNYSLCEALGQYARGPGEVVCMVVVAQARYPTGYYIQYYWTVKVSPVHSLICVFRHHLHKISWSLHLMIPEMHSNNSRWRSAWLLNKCVICFLQCHNTSLSQ